jgi:outer membrane receptor protein involved in Fe transport
VRQAQAAQVVTGVVRDSAGGVVPGAVVVARTTGGAVQRTVTGPDGRFTIALPAPVELTVSAVGFAEATQAVDAAGGAAPLEIVVTPAGFVEQVTVTPTRGEQRLGDVPASVNVMRREDIRQSPAIVADDLLRQMPQFALFRRSSSVSAHPTSQGVSLRGIGPSGVSRSLVLLDGVPYNDGFGGWVYWTGIPLEGAERIEVVDGASSSLYGTYAMGGVINIMTRPPAAQTFEMKSQYGSRGTPKLDFRGSNVWGKVGVSVDATLFDTDGYQNIVPAEAGTVDENVSVMFRNFSGKVDYNPTDRVQVFFRGGYFREERNNGKRTTVEPTAPEANDTSWQYASGGVRVQLPDSSDLRATMFTNVKTFRGNFLSIGDGPTPPRSFGRVALNQEVPSTDIGGMVQWSRALAQTHVLTAGTDFRWVDGDSNETVMNFAHGLTPVTFRVSGGTQRTVGAFVQDLISPIDRLTITLSARLDRWRNYDPHHTETSAATGAVTVRDLAPRQDTVVSPRAGVLYRLTDQVSVWGDIATGFRAPTLNELYRQFQVGAVLTRANDQLGPERLKGGELGLNVAPMGNLVFRTTWFDNRVKDPVSNTTISPSNPNLQQRRNLGRTRIWGVQNDVDYRFQSFWRVSAAYLFERATVTENPDDPTLVGRFLAQVPKHRGSLQLQYANPRYLSAFLDVQFVGRQFDDDRNNRVVPGEREPGLPGFTLVNVSATRAIGSNLDVFFAAENLLDSRYFVGTFPTLVGPPRLVLGGIRLKFQGQ